MEIVSDIVSVAANGSLNIKPGTGEKWIIMVITHEYDVEIYHTDGTNAIKIDSATGNGAWTNLRFPINENKYLQVKNLDSANARLIGYSGVKV